MIKNAAEQIDHKRFMASLSPELRAALTVRSDRAGLWHLIAHWGLMVVVGVPIATGWPFWWALLPVQGILIIFNFTLCHECTHKSPFRTSWLNEAVGWISGAMVGLPFLWFRAFHMAHHRFTNDPNRDPELAGGAKPNGWRPYLWHVSGVSVWAAQLRVLAGNAVGRINPDFVAARARAKIQIEAIVLILIYAGLGLLFPALFWLWLVPVAFGQPILRLYLLAEHGRCPAVANMLENSRTTFTNRLVRFLAWNMPYHAEHHTAPNVPFYLLPKMHTLVQAHLKSTSPGYLAFHRAFVSGFHEGQAAPK